MKLVASLPPGLSDKTRRTDIRRTTTTRNMLLGPPPSQETFRNVNYSSILPEQCHLLYAREMCNIENADFRKSMHISVTVSTYFIHLWLAAAWTVCGANGEYVAMGQHVADAICSFVQRTPSTDIILEIHLGYWKLLLTIFQLRVLHCVARRYADMLNNL